MMALTASKRKKKKEISEPVNYIWEYWKQIMSGEILVSERVYKTYAHIVDMLESPPEGYHFEVERGQRVIDFVEKFCHPSKGAAARKPLKLMLWQKALLQAVYSFVDDDGNRLITEVFLTVARKNGKSAIASALSLYHLTKDGENGPEVYCYAGKKDQAKIVWNESVKMIKKSPALNKRLQCRVNTIRCDGNDGDYRPLASDSGTLDGLNCSFAVSDECHQYNAQNGMYEIVHDSMSARDNPLMFIVTTAGFIREGFWDKKLKDCDKIHKGYEDGSYIDNRTLFFVYQLDSEDEIWDEKTWVKANPGIDVIKKRNSLQEKVYKAKADRSQLNNLLTKDFDIPQSNKSAFFGMSHLNHATHDINQLHPDYYIAGVDLSRTTDLTSASIIYRVQNDDTIYVDSMSWMPEDTLKEHLQDGVPYQTWIEQGWLRLCRGNLINDQDVVDWLYSHVTESDCYMYRTGYDRYSASHFIQEMSSTFGEKSLIAVAQGTKTLSQPMETSKKLFEQKKINYNNNPLFSWCMLNVEAKTDVNGNIQPVKNRDLNVRIDAYASFLNAFVVYNDYLEEYMARIS